MNSRKVVFLFWTSLLIGSVSGAIVGFAVDYDVYIGDDFANFILGIIWLLGLSAAFSLVAQMGFFAYLFVHRFGLGLAKTHTLWNRIQLVIIAFVFFDLVYFRYLAFGGGENSFFGYLLTPTLLLLYSLIIAYFKAKDTNRGAFVPALFFMFVITTIEWVPALTVNDQKWLWIYLAPLLSANTWQLLVLHRLTNRK
ncbi:KinB-signaling pathway activation protein [Shouchella shacheensis]|uniref:KinB-signaling pathway activation protein n=1 Tax=Shouchella shacheensis TaxID=1649580 RepID=UPI00073FED17|nr:KinB-signaling pathway activation protein [Shouchella shacheensis]